MYSFAFAKYRSQTRQNGFLNQSRYSERLQQSHDHFWTQVLVLDPPRRGLADRQFRQRLVGGKDTQRQGPSFMKFPQGRRKNVEI